MIHRWQISPNGCSVPVPQFWQRKETALNRPYQDSNIRIDPLGRPLPIQLKSHIELEDRELADTPILPFSDEDTIQFDPHAGEVMAFPQVFAIYWGRSYGTPTSGKNTVAASMDSFLTTVMHSRYLDMLSQYEVSGGTFLGSTWIDHEPNPETVSESQMRELLISWIDADPAPRLPVPHPDDKNLLFLIFPSSEISLTLFGRTDFCGYHYWGHYKTGITQKDNLFFGVVDTTGGTGAVSHELVEAFTDRSHNGWYSDAEHHSEIADTCSACRSRTLSLSGFPVASYWLVAETRCLQQSDLTPDDLAVVPSVIGQKGNSAAKILVDQGFLLRQQLIPDHSCEHIGRVISQRPRGGTEVRANSTVSIVIGTRPPHECPPAGADEP
jgi:hypothetical protein